MCSEGCVQNIGDTVKSFTWFYTAQQINVEIFFFVVANQALIRIV